MYHQSSDSEGGFTALRKHEEYYLPGGDLFFLIEQNHFRVHRYFFERESAYFKAQLATPASPGASRQGTSESTAIVLNDVKAESFAKFLWVFYNPKYSLYHAKVDDWVAILDLAYRWGFAEVKALVIREVERLWMSDIHRVVVYHKYDIDRRLLFANYAALVAREEPLTLQEGMELGMDTTLKIFRAREIARATPADNGIRSPRPVSLPPGEMRSLVTELFEIVLDDEEVTPPPVEKKPRSPDEINGTNGKVNGINGTNGKINGKNTTNGSSSSKNAESTTPKTGVSPAVTKAVNGIIDAKPATNGTPNGVKDSTTTSNPTTTTASNPTLNTTPTPTSNTPSTTTANTSSITSPTTNSTGSIWDRVSGLSSESIAAQNGKANETKVETDEAKKDAKEADAAKDAKKDEKKEEEKKDDAIPTTPRPETPSGSNKNAGKGGKAGKKNGWGL